MSAKSKVRNDGFDSALESGFDPGLDSGFDPGLGLDEHAAAFAEAGQDLPDLCAENGRGLFLIRALMDHVQFRNHPRSGAVVSFDKMLKYRDRPLLHAS